MPDRDPAERLRRELSGWSAPATGTPVWSAPRNRGGGRFAIALGGAVVAVACGSALALAAPGPAGQVPVRIVEMFTRIATEPEPSATPTPAVDSPAPPPVVEPVTVPPVPSVPIRIVREPVPPASSGPNPAAGKTEQAQTEHERSVGSGERDHEGGGEQPERAKHQEQPEPPEGR